MLADSYVSSREHTENYGNATNLKVAKDQGSGNYLYESYLFFNISEKPNEFIKAEISLRLFAWSSGTSITVSLINSSWEESTIIWDNKPSHDDVLESFIWTGYGIKKIEMNSMILIF